LQNLIRRADNAAVYEWMLDELTTPNGWLYEAFSSINIPFTISPEMRRVRKSVEDENGNARIVFTGLGLRD